MTLSQQLIYPWRRFWVREEATSNIRNQGLFFSSFRDENTALWEEISDKPCLVLLGEPGMGKSKAYEEAVQASPDCATISLNLGSYGSEDRLLRNLFENDTFQSWLNGDHKLRVMLDSLDECLLRLNYVATLLGDELHRYLHGKSALLERLNFSIFCRTAVWPRYLEEKLRRIWGEDPKTESRRVHVYELAPLSREDVVLAAQTRGFDADAFVTEIYGKHAESLATKPVTLTLLLNLYGQGGTLPSTEAELYTQGCLRLCEELDNPATQGTGIRNRVLDPNQQLALASRIAALTIFSNREAIWVGIDDGLLTEGDLRVQDALGGTESVALTNGLSTTFEVSQSAINETLGTGLFSSRGANRLGWSHRTYAEFLAGYYLANRKSPLIQLQQLFAHPQDPEGRLVPQLHETAARLTSMPGGIPHEFFSWLLQVEPEVLLESDVSSADDVDRLALARTLLEKMDAKQVTYLPLHRLHSLKCDGLENLLRSWIQDVGKLPESRDAAIDVAIKCQMSSLMPDILPIALDSHLPFLVRRTAMNATEILGTSEEKRQLLPLAEGVPEDEEQQLKGTALAAMWPQAITATELFRLITQPSNDSLFGAYEHFLASDLIRHLQVSDLPLALAWAREQRGAHEFAHEFGTEQLIDDLVRSAWDNLDNPTVLSALAELAHFYLQAGRRLTKTSDTYRVLYQRPPTEELFVRDGSKRHLLLEAIFPKLVNDFDATLKLHYLSVPIVVSEDVEWALNQLDVESDAMKRRVWVKLIELIASFEQIHLVLDACARHRDLAKAYDWAYRPIKWPSKESKRLRKRYRKSRRRQVELSRRERGSVSGPPPSERVQRLLEQSEDGNLAAWWKIVTYELTLEPEDTHFRSDRQLVPDITTLPGWKAASEDTRQRLIAAAERYAHDGHGDLESWADDPLNWWPAVAGYKALRLLSHSNPQVLEQLPDSAWNGWVPVVLNFSGVHFFSLAEPGDLLAAAYRRVPQTVIMRLLRQIDLKNSENASFYFQAELEALWGDTLADALLRKTNDSTLNKEILSEIFKFLLAHATVGAKELAFARVEESREIDTNGRSISVALAIHLLHFTTDGSWESLWPYFQSDPTWGRKVAESLAYDDRRSETLHKNLKAHQIAEFYVWLCEQYPHDQDPKTSGFHDISHREEIARFRDSLPNFLSTIGSFEAYNQLRRLCDILPKINSLRQYRNRAGEQARRKTWVAPTPEQILRLTHNPKTRWITNADQLLVVVIEALEGLNRDLQGSSPLAPMLWNDWPEERPEGKRGRAPKLYRPKDEETFSRFVARHLNDTLKATGIIINREVEIRPGEFTDIHIDVAIPSPIVTQGEAERASIIVEAKGCWHTDLAKAMEAQLVNDYLYKNQIHHGIYLVGWFECDKWDVNDGSRKGVALRFAISPSEAQAKLNDQANKLSQHGLTVKAVVLDTRLR